MPGTSIREWIRWGADAESEPTSTVVLTSPERRFVDIRVLKSAPAEAAGGPQGTLPLSHLDWAFAGVSSTEDRDGKTHCKWRHTVDSRTPRDSESAVVDEAVVIETPDHKFLEAGCMVNPETGLMTAYEELWVDEEEGDDGEREQPTSTSSSSLQHHGRGGGVVVLEIDTDKVRGVVVCLGTYCQGVVRIGERFAAERWKRGGGDGVWKRMYRFGDDDEPGGEEDSLWMPCAGACGAVDEGDVGLGRAYERGGHRWSVVESHMSKRRVA